jgi:hypothetical protein
MGAHEELEHAEHTAHAGQHGAKHMGLTMGILAVLIAFCAAMVGSQRQELMTSLLDQSWAHSSFTAAATDHRLLMNELEKMRGTPRPAGDNASGSLTRFVRLATHYQQERELAKEWDDDCQELIDAHFDAAEGYEHAQLVAELAVIIASIAILLNSRPAWFVSIAVGVICLGMMSFTFIGSRSAIAKHHEEVEEAEEAYVESMNGHLESTEDDVTLNELDPGGKMRAEVPKPEKHAGGHAPGKPNREPAKPEAAKPEATKAEE